MLGVREVIFIKHHSKCMASGFAPSPPCCATDKVDRLEKTQPTPQQKEKHEQDMEKMAQLLQHKRDKLTRKWAISWSSLACIVV